MTNSENMTTARPETVPYDEIHGVRTKIYQLVDDYEINGDSPLVAAIFFILDTLEAGKAVTVMALPDPTDYILV